MTGQVLRFPVSSPLMILIVGLIVTAPTRAMQNPHGPQQAPEEQSEKDIESRYKQGTKAQKTMRKLLMSLKRKPA